MFTFNSYNSINGEPTMHEFTTLDEALAERDELKRQLFTECDLIATNDSMTVFSEDNHPCNLCHQPSNRISLDYMTWLHEDCEAKMDILAGSEPIPA
jgi:hypothetical protein